MRLKNIVLVTATTLTLSMGLVSCGPPPEPQVFGVPEHVWVTLSPQERQQIIQGYNTQQKINAQNAPIEGVIGATSVLVAHQQDLNQLDRPPTFPVPVPQPVPIPVPSAP